jgi:deoxyribonuclease-4
MAAMVADEPRLGIHLAHAIGLVRAAERAVELRLTTVQVFGDNPTAYRRRAEPSTELPAFRERLAGAGIAPVAIHASYLVNPAGADPVNRERSIELLASELETAPRFGATLVNVHIGSHGGAGVEAGCRSIVDVVGRARELATARGATDLPLIALEKSAGGGFGMGVDVDELAGIRAALDAAGLDGRSVGFCLDAAHAWGAGIDMADPATIDDLLESFDRRVGLDRLRLVHLNDSSTGRGSRTDRHQLLGAGQIGAVGLGHLIRHPRLRGIPFILETPGMEDGYDAVNVERARALLRGEPLADLPPEAFQARGSRSRGTAPATDPGHPPRQTEVAAFGTTRA